MSGDLKASQKTQLGKRLTDQGPEALEVSEEQKLFRGFLESDRVYLDHNATSPPAEFLSDILEEGIKYWGNPSSIHFGGRGPKLILREARQKWAKALNCSPLELIFTAGGSESNNLAIKGVWSANEEASKNVIISTQIEHPSVVKALDWLASQGAIVERVEVDRGGAFDLKGLEKLLSKYGERVLLVTCMLANNETGTILPVKKIASAAHKVGALMHTDAVQALGKMLFDLKSLGVDLATFSGHKFYSLKGCGLLYSKTGTQLEPLIHGGGQERRRRAGTENLLAIKAFGELAGWTEKVSSFVEHTQVLRDLLQSEIEARLSGVTVNGAEARRLGNTLNLCIDGVDGESMLMSLDLLGFAVSTGAACSAGSPEPSPTLLAMGLTVKEAQSSLRLSLGWGTMADDIHRFVDALEKTVNRLRKISSSDEGMH